EAKGLIAYDIMTERYEITSILQRDLVSDADVFGSVVPGTLDAPGVLLESVHHLMKSVAGVPLRRPAWVFGTTQHGEGRTDAAPPLAGPVPWMLFATQARARRRDLQVHQGRRWPTTLSREDFRRVTGESDCPDYLTAYTRNDQLDDICNTAVSYRLRGF